jgi:hypothetical protein
MMSDYTRVAITLDDGTVALMSFITHGRGSILPYGAEWSKTPGYWVRPATDDNIFQEISRAHAVGPQPVKYRIVDESEIPADRTFRNALVDKGGKLMHDMDKAKELHRAKIRRHRVALFAENDLALMTAMADGDKPAIAAAKARRQELRDAPANPAIDAAQTTEELKAISVA